MGETCNINTNISLDNILKLPHVLHSKETSLNKKTETAFFDSIEAIIKDLIQSQKKEGTNLQKDLIKQFQSIKKQIITIKKTILQIIKEKKKNLSSIMKKTASKSEDVDMCSIEIKKTNLVHELEKIDINEELVRFSSHIKNITDIIN